MPRSMFTLFPLFAAAAAAFFMEAAAAEPAAPADGPIRDPAGVKGYAVHEWGVFTIHPDLEMANAALAAEWADCPRELYRTEPPNLRNLPWRGSVRKPIVYFHWAADPPPPEQGLTMKVRFPDGRPVIWWPASEEGAGIKAPGASWPAHEPVCFAGIATGGSPGTPATKTTFCDPRSPGWKPGDSGTENHPARHAA